MAYIQPKSGGSYEIFRITKPQTYLGEDMFEPPGWYWWACWPGCMPDGDAVGPFETEQAAIDDVMNLADA